MTCFYKIFFLLLLSISFSTHSQSVLSEYAQNSNFPIQERLSNETILRISNTKRVFILSLKNQGFLPGDFITLIYRDQHIARAIVAKAKEERAGIKIIKIYSPTLWNQLREGLDISILRGDDSYFITKKKKRGIKLKITLPIKKRPKLQQVTIFSMKKHF